MSRPYATKSKYGSLGQGDGKLQHTETIGELEPKLKENVLALWENSTINPSDMRSTRYSSVVIPSSRQKLAKRQMLEDIGGQSP